jgi:flagellar protein FliO/FliZ
VLDQILGDIPTPLKFVIAFAVIILLIVVAVWLGRRFGGQRFGPAAATGRSRQPRLGVLDVLAVDGRRRLVIVRRDNVEHLIMIGGPNDVVVESGILRVPAGMTAQRDAPAVLPADPAPSRTAPPQPVPPSPGPRVAPAAERAQPERQQPKTVEAPPIVPAQRVAAAQPAQQRPPAPPARPAPQAEAPAARPQPAPARPAPPVEAPKPTEPAGEDRPTAQPPAPQPAPTAGPRPVPQQIIAGPAGRGAAAPRGPAPTTRSSDLAERLAAALKRPVQPAPERAQAQAQSAPAAPAAPVASAILAAVAAPTAPAAAPAAESAEPKAAPAPQAGPSKADEDLPREMPPMGDKPAPEAKPDQKPAAPEVKTEPRAEKPETPEDDPLASLEAEMANLLGRDVAKRP